MWVRAFYPYSSSLCHSLVQYTIAEQPCKNKLKYNNHLKELRLFENWGEEESLVKSVPSGGRRCRPYRFSEAMT